MRINSAGIAFNVEKPALAAAWLTEHFGFTIGVDLGWYINAVHADQPQLSIDFLQRGHESTYVGMRDAVATGVLLAFLVEDADAEERRLREAGAEIATPLVSEPWGQRRFTVQGPENLLVEVLQLVEPDPEWLAANMG